MIKSAFGKSKGDKHHSVPRAMCLLLAGNVLPPFINSSRDGILIAFASNYDLIASHLFLILIEWLNDFILSRAHMVVRNTHKMYEKSKIERSKRKMVYMSTSSLVSKRCLNGNYCGYFTEYVWIDCITYILDMLIAFRLHMYTLASMKCTRCTRIKNIR